MGEIKMTTDVISFSPSRKVKASVNVTEAFSSLFIPSATLVHPQTCFYLLMNFVFVLCFPLHASFCVCLFPTCGMFCSCLPSSLAALSGTCAAGEIANASVRRDSEHQTMFYTASHSLAGWLDMMLVPYLHADTHWTLIEIHCGGTCVEFQAAFLAVL